jgi:hypothetical protein
VQPFVRIEGMFDDGCGYAYAVKVISDIDTYHSTILMFQIEILMPLIVAGLPI